MSGALALLHGLREKVRGSADYRDCSRTLQVDIPPPSSVDVEFTDLTLKVSAGLRTKSKTILKGVSGLFNSGELTAIMGPSGAGKSSLMNALTGFATKGVTGTIRAGDSVCNFGSNQNLRSLKAYRKKSCYILQDDRLNPLFTVAEIMKFAADLKLGETLTEKLKNSVISDVLDTLGLSGTENTRCGNLSGGQKKRLSIAMELIDNPPVVFLDEPTTGLDSLTSSQCIEMLKNLSRSGRTIVCTIHQPSASIYALFDQVYILAEGMCVYNGTSDNTVPYLSSFGLQCPVYHNPADYMLEIANNEYGKFNETLANNCRKKDWCVRTSAVTQPTTGKSDCFSYGKTTIAINPPNELYKFKILFKRSLIQQYRDWTMTHMKVLLHFIIGTLLGVMYYGAGNDASRSVSNVGYLLICTLYLCYTSLMPAVLRFPQELPVVKKEKFNNWYDLKTYYAAVLVTSIPIQVWCCFVYSLPSYFLSGQPQDLQRFAMFVLCLSCTTVLADSVGSIIGTLVNPINGTFIGALLTSAMLAFAGFLVLINHMTRVMRFISYISFMRYSLEALVISIYAYDRPPLACNMEYCHYKYPAEIIDIFDFKPQNFWSNITIMVVETIVVRIVAYWTLRRIVKN